MNSKYLLTAIAIVLVVVVGLFIYNQNDNDVDSDTNTVANSNTAANVNANTPAANTNQNTNTSAPAEPTAPDGNDVAVFEVTYDGKAFTPSKLTINNGDVVIFKNESSTSFWPASGPHPTHTNYPEFDPKKAIGPGQTWQFKFTQSGTWPYHDHLNPSAFGTITVK